MKPLAAFLLAALAVCIFTATFFAGSADASGRNRPIAELTASDGQANSFLGQSVAISNGVVFAGVFQLGQGASIYVFERPASGWVSMTQTAELTIPGTNLFLNAIAASGDVVVGSVRGAGPKGTGALYVFQKPAGGWHDMTPTAVLTPTSGDRFGMNVGIAGDTIVAGDPGCNGEGDFSAGAALVFQKPAGGWQDMNQTAILSATDSQPCDDFGISVSTSGNTVAVGASLEGMFPPPSTGEVYVYEKPANGWTNMTQTAELTLQQPFAGDGVGRTVAIGGNTVASSLINRKGNPGILVFEKPASGWSNGWQTATLLKVSGPIAVNPLGKAIATGGESAGVVKVFFEPGGGWQNTSSANYENARKPSDFLGNTGIAISDVTLAAGAPGTTVNGNASQGAVFLYPK